LSYTYYYAAVGEIPHILISNISAIYRRGHERVQVQFPYFDVWILRYHGTELDDGAPSSGWGPPFEANLDAFLTGEPINGQDVVVWYGAHFTHNVQAEPPGVYGDLVGPDLKPVKW
jgi:hypothetical protein